PLRLVRARPGLLPGEQIVRGPGRALPALLVRDGRLAGDRSTPLASLLARLRELLGGHRPPLRRQERGGVAGADDPAFLVRAERVYTRARGAVSRGDICGVILGGRLGGVPLEIG